MTPGSRAATPVQGRPRRPGPRGGADPTAGGGSTGEGQESEHGRLTGSLESGAQLCGKEIASGERIGSTAVASGLPGRAGTGNATIVMKVSAPMYKKYIQHPHNDAQSLHARLQFLRSSYIFEAWPTRELLHLAYRVEGQRFPARKVITRSGDPFHGMLIVHSGEAKMQTTMDVGAPEDLTHVVHDSDSTLKPAICRKTVDLELIGHLTVIGDTEVIIHSTMWLNTCIALSDCDVFRIPTGVYAGTATHTITSPHTHTHPVSTQRCGRALWRQKLATSLALASGWPGSLR